MKYRRFSALIILLFFLRSCGEAPKSAQNIHFSPLKNKIGSLKELLYNEGEFHLFYLSGDGTVQDANTGTGYAVSRDLINWREVKNAKDGINDNVTSDFEGSVGSPLIFKLPVDGNPIIQKWVLQQTDGSYYVGSYDGNLFIKESELLKNNFGNCFFSPVILRDPEPGDDRTIQLANAGNSMLLPLELSLRITENGIRLYSNPVREADILIENVQEWNEIDYNKEKVVNFINGEALRIRARFTASPGSWFGFRLHGKDVIFSLSEMEMSSMELKAPLDLLEGKLFIEIFADRNIIEIFCNEGSVYMPLVFENVEEYGIEFIKGDGYVVAEALQVFSLKSI